MDDGDAVNPREAVAGLGLLGAAMLALVGTFVYRIVMENPTQPRPTSETPVFVDANAPLSPLETDAPPVGDAGSTQAAAPVPVAPPETPDAAPPSTEKTQESADSEAPPFTPEPMPQFVAPASRPN